MSPLLKEYDKFRRSVLRFQYIKIHLISRILQYSPYQGFTFYANQRLFLDDYIKRGFIPFNYYEFGVAAGRSAEAYSKGLYSFCKYKNIKINNFNMFLFDSFEGMPLPRDKIDEGPQHFEGQYQSSIDLVKERLKINKNKINVHFIKGFFEESLTPELFEKLTKTPPSIVRIDVQYYSSAMLVLNFIKPLLQNGCIIYFENISDYLNCPFKGEIAALYDFNKRYEQEKTIIYPIQSTFGIPLLQNHVYVYTSLDVNVLPKI